jgi:hypothetical protein
LLLRSDEPQSDIPTPIRPARVTKSGFSMFTSINLLAIRERYCSNNDLLLFVANVGILCRLWGIKNKHCSLKLIRIASEGDGEGTVTGDSA